MSKINRTPRDPPVSGFYTERAFRSLEERDNRGTFHFVDQRVPYRLTLTNQQFVQTASYRAVYFFSKKKKISAKEKSLFTCSVGPLVCPKLILEISTAFRVPGRITDISAIVFARNWNSLIKSRAAIF